MTLRDFKELSRKILTPFGQCAIWGAADKAYIVFITNPDQGYRHKSFDITKPRRKLVTSITLFAAKCILEKPCDPGLRVIVDNGVSLKTDWIKLNYN